MSSALSLRVTLLTLALASLAGAVSLELTGNDPYEAWGAFIALVGVLTGQQLPTPANGV